MIEGEDDGDGDEERGEWGAGWCGREQWRETYVCCIAACCECWTEGLLSNGEAAGNEGCGAVECW